MSLVSNKVSGADKGGGADKAAELASESFAKLTSLLEEVADSSMNVYASQDTDLNTLAGRRLITVQKMLNILTNTPLTDPLRQAVESQITIPQFLNELSRERKELQTALQNVELNKDSLTTLLDNAWQRDKNLKEIIKGMEKETNAIEDEDPAVELRELEKMKKRMLRNFNTILDRAYPDLKTDIKNILEALASWESADPFMPIPESVQGPALLLLEKAQIIELDFESRRMKLLVAKPIP